MFASLILAATVAFPAAGTYTYEIDTPTGRQFVTSIVIAPDANGVTTHEAFGAPLIASTDQRFNAQLQPVSYAGGNVGQQLVQGDFSGNDAELEFEGHTRSVTLDNPSCVVVEDNVLTSNLMLPAIVAATHATACTFVIIANGQAVDGDVVPTTEARPAHAAASDAAVTVTFNAITETMWYDPHSLVVDYIDFGKSGTATLTATSPSTAIPSPAPSPSPTPSPTP